MPPVIYRDAHAGIAVFDLNEPESLYNLHSRITQFTDNAKSDVVLVLVGNKSDIYTEKSQLAAQLLDQ